MNYRVRRVILTLLSLGVLAFIVFLQSPQDTKPTPTPVVVSDNKESAISKLQALPVKGRAPKTDYSRDQFGNGWTTTMGCDTRNIILNRDMTNVVTNEECEVTKGTLNDPYTGSVIEFERGSNSAAVQIDHVVALSNAWQTGAQQLTLDQRTSLANDPLELLAVDGPANQKKSDGDAATWLPSNKAFRCEYVARQIAVKIKYTLWVTQAEHDSIASILSSCPNQLLP